LNKSLKKGATADLCLKTYENGQGKSLYRVFATKLLPAPKALPDSSARGRAAKKRKR